jgi:hypothetical protein
MAERNEVSVGRRVVVMLAYLIVGAPLVAYLWETLNEILAGDIYAPRLLISLPLLVVLIVLLVLLARQGQRWEGPEPGRS